MHKKDHVGACRKCGKSLRVGYEVLPSKQSGRVRIVAIRAAKHLTVLCNACAVTVMDSYA